MSVEQGAWPDRSYYARLVLAPENFTDEELRGASLTMSRRGGPRVWSGARAMVFQVRTADARLLAVRVFLNAQAADPIRYAALSRHLEQRAVPTFVWTRWVEDGLACDATRVPLIKMHWVDGLPLDEYLETCIARDRPGPTLAYLAEEWRRQCRTLTGSDVAHGDIHAQNVLVCPDAEPGHVRYQLVDYDGVWVPSLRRAPSEVGHAAYQHPRHLPDHWGPTVDAFPATLVYLSLRALAAEPDLWARFHTDDTLLFRYEDLTDVRSAVVWRALAASPESFVRALAAVVVTWLDDRPDALRSLEEAVVASGSVERTSSEKAVGGVAPPNVWPPSPGPATTPGDRQSWGAATTTPPRPLDPTTTAATQQQWPAPQPARGAGGAPRANKPTRDLWIWVLVAVIIIGLIAVLV